MKDVSNCNLKSCSRLRSSGTFECAIVIQTNLRSGVHRHKGRMNVSEKYVKHADTIFVFMKLVLRSITLRPTNRGVYFQNNIDKIEKLCYR
jgi:hypothetical protein